MTMIFNDIRKLAEFEKDFKKLVKKFRTLDDDLNAFISNQLKLTHKKNIDNKGVVIISDLGIEYPKIYKARKFACKSLKGKGAASGIRVIYAYYEQDDVIEFVEIYYKGNKENEDRERILRYYGKREKDPEKIERVLRQKRYPNSQLPRGKVLHHIIPVSEGGKMTLYFLNISKLPYIMVF